MRPLVSLGRDAKYRRWSERGSWPKRLFSSDGECVALRHLGTSGVLLLAIFCAIDEVCAKLFVGGVVTRRNSTHLKTLAFWATFVSF